MRGGWEPSQGIRVQPSSFNFGKKARDLAASHVLACRAGPALAPLPSLRVSRDLTGQAGGLCGRKGGKEREKGRERARRRDGERSQRKVEQGESETERNRDPERDRG